WPGWGVGGAGCAGRVAGWVVGLWLWLGFGWAAARCGGETRAAARPGRTVPAGTFVVTVVVRETALGATSTTGPLCRQVSPGPISTLRVIRAYSVRLTVIRFARQSGRLQPQSGATTAKPRLTSNPGSIVSATNSRGGGR